MNYYIGYFNESWDKSKFTVICKTYDKATAIFILEQYLKYNDGYVMMSEEQASALKLVF